MFLMVKVVIREVNEVNLNVNETDVRHKCI